MRRLFLLAFIWGWSFLFIKVAGEGLTPLTVAWARIALGAAVLALVLRRQSGRVPTDRRASPAEEGRGRLRRRPSGCAAAIPSGSGAYRRHFVVVALCGSVVPFTLLAWAEQHITSALTAVLNASTPLFTALVAAAALSERLRRLQVAGLAVGMLGVAVAAGLGASDLRSSSVPASLAAILAGLCYGIAFVYTRRHLTSIPPLVAATGQLVAGTALLAPLAVASSAVGGVELTPSRVTSIVLLGALGTGLAYVLNYRIIAELGPTKASLVTYLVPVVAVVAGIVVLDEPAHWRLLVGGGLTVAGIVAVNRRPAAQAAADRARAVQRSSP